MQHIDRRQLGSNQPEADTKGSCVMTDDPKLVRSSIIQPDTDVVILTKQPLPFRGDLLKFFPKSEIRPRTKGDAYERVFASIEELDALIEAHLKESHFPDSCIDSLSSYVKQMARYVEVNSGDGQFQFMCFRRDGNLSAAVDPHTHHPEARFGLLVLAEEEIDATHITPTSDLSEGVTSKSEQLAIWEGHLLHHEIPGKGMSWGIRLCGFPQNVDDPR